MRILLLDNYDSFTFNLRQLIENSGDNEIIVEKNDKIELNEVSKFDAIVLSPGPDIPQNSGKMMQIISENYKKIPIFGVCLGFQAIATFFGGNLINLPKVMHGQRVPIGINSKTTIYKGIDKKIYVGLYHSWAVEKNNIPNCLKITAVYKNVVMSIEHKKHKICGVQYHPESYMTNFGQKIFDNWINSL